MENILQDIIQERITKRNLSSHEFVVEAKDCDMTSIDVSDEILDIVRSTIELKRYTRGDYKKKQYKKKTGYIDIFGRKLEDKMNLSFQKINTMTDTKLDDMIVLAIAYYDMGVFCNNDKKLTALDTETHFLRSVELLKGKELERKVILIIITVLNNLGIICINLNKQEKSLSFFNKALELYLRYTREEDEYPDPINVFTLVSLLLFKKPFKTLNVKVLLDQLHLTTILHLSNLYAAEPKDKHEFVMYVHNLLKKNIPVTKCSGRNFVDWIMTTISLSHYFISNHCITDARKLIVAAQYMQEIFEKNLLQQRENIKSHIHIAYELRELYATNVDCFLQYALALLRISSLRLLENENVQYCKLDTSKLKVHVKSMKELNTVPIHDRKQFMTDKYVTNFNDAEIIFNDILECFNITKGCLTFQEYIKAKMHIYYAHKYLTKFTQNKDKRITLYKQQIENLEAVLKEIHSDVKIVKLHTDDCLCITVWRELLITYSNLYDIKTEHVMINVEQLNEELPELPKEITQSLRNNIRHIQLIKKFC